MMDTLVIMIVAATYCPRSFFSGRSFSLAEEPHFENTPHPSTPASWQPLHSWRDWKHLLVPREPLHHLLSPLTCLLGACSSVPIAISQHLTELAPPSLSQLSESGFT